MGADHVQGYLLARPSTDPASWSAWWDRNWIYPTTIDLDAERNAGVALVGG
jgi:hypothetical protein